MTTPTPPKKPRLSTGLRIVFGLSLALNLLIVGIVAGFLLRGGPVRDLSAGMQTGRMLYRELPKENREVLRRALRTNVDRTVLQSARIGPELNAALRAEPFDPDALIVLLDRQADALRAGQEVMRDQWLGIVTEMSPEERATYADRLHEAAKRGPKRRPGPPGN